MQGITQRPEKRSPTRFIILILIFSGKKGNELKWAVVIQEGQEARLFCTMVSHGPPQRRGSLGLRSSFIIFHLVDPGGPVTVSCLTPGICGNIRTRCLAVHSHRCCWALNCLNSRPQSYSSFHPIFAPHFYPLFYYSLRKSL